MQGQPGQHRKNQIDEANGRSYWSWCAAARWLAQPILPMDEVMVWPSLVWSRRVCATVFLLLADLSLYLHQRAAARPANPNQTPEPVESSWYFLNMQELLLHMDPGLAGVIVPSLTLVALAAIPYVDRSPLGVGILGTSAKGRKIIGFTAVFTIVVIVGLILLDEWRGRGTVFGIGSYLHERGWPREFTEIILPSIVMLGGIVTLMILVQLIFKPTRREMIIALFTGFYVGYWVLTIFGTSFRSVGQDLSWPWNLPLVHH